MKTNSFLLAAIFGFALAFTFSCSSPDDDNSGNGGCRSDKGNNMANYKIVQIGAQTWMAENLNYNVSGSVCYYNSEAKGAEYGRLYDWETAKTVCPSGWHLPSDADWDKLINYVESNNGCSSCAARYLKATIGWDGNDKYGFSALPGGGGHSDGSFLGGGSSGNWWSATETGVNAYSWYMFYTNEDVYKDFYNKDRLYSVRCVQD